MVADFGFQHLSAGDLLRAEVQKGSALGQQLDATMKVTTPLYAQTTPRGFLVTWRFGEPLTTSFTKSDLRATPDWKQGLQTIDGRARK